MVGTSEVAFVRHDEHVHGGGRVGDLGQARVPLRGQRRSRRQVVVEAVAGPAALIRGRTGDGLTCRSGAPVGTVVQRRPGLHFAAEPRVLVRAPIRPQRSDPGRVLVSMKPGVRQSHVDHDPIVVDDVAPMSDFDLTHVVHASHRVGHVPSPPEGGQEDRDQQTHNADDHKQFDERERAATQDTPPMTATGGRSGAGIQENRTVSGNGGRWPASRMAHWYRSSVDALGCFLRY